MVEQRTRNAFNVALGGRRRSSTVDLIGFRCVNGSQRLWAVGGDCAQLFPRRDGPRHVWDITAGSCAVADPDDGGESSVGVS